MDNGEQPPTASVLEKKRMKEKAKRQLERAEADLVKKAAGWRWDTEARVL